MKNVLLALAVLLSAATSADAAIVKWSTSGVDANEGSNLTLQLGSTGSIYVWASTDSGEAIRGFSFDAISDNPSILEGTDHIIEEPTGRWLSTGPGTLGDLVTGSNAIASSFLGQTGINTGGEENFVLHSEIQLLATELGTTNVMLQEGTAGISDGSNSIATQFFGGTVNVTAVPEPGTCAVLGLGAVTVWLRRKRRA